MTSTRKTLPALLGLAALGVLAIAPAANAQMKTSKQGAAAAVQQSTSEAPQWHFFAETEVLPLTLGGFALYGGVRVPSMPQLRLGLGGDIVPLPDMAVNTGTNTGWAVKSQGLGAMISYSFAESGDGLFVATLLGYGQNTYTRADTAGQSANVSYLTAMPYVGYQWFPMKHGFYVVPWLGAGLATRLSGTPTVGTATYAEAAVNPNFGLTLGYEF